MFSGTLSQSQVDGMNGILDGWEAKYSGDDDRWLAYALATTYHETDQHMQPIEEYGKGRGLPYGKPDLETGKVYYGRGFVQLTWKKNYQTMGDKIGVDLVTYPELALEVDNATQILFIGMIEGLFTGKSLGSYFNGKIEDWVNARRIITDWTRPRRSRFMAITSTPGSATPSLPRGVPVQADQRALWHPSFCAPVSRRL